MSQVPTDLKYTKEHEWAREEGGELAVGITDFAQSQLGDVVFVDLPKVGARVISGKTFGVVESVKTVSDLYAPLSGVITKINDELAKNPDLVNREPYGGGWMIHLKPDNGGDWNSLLSAADYSKLVGG